MCSKYIDFLRYIIYTYTYVCVKKRVSEPTIRKWMCGDVYCEKLIEDFIQSPLPLSR